MPSDVSTEVQIGTKDGKNGKETFVHNKICEKSDNASHCHTSMMLYNTKLVMIIKISSLFYTNSKKTKSLLQC